MEGGPPVFPSDSTCPMVLWILLCAFPFHLQDSHLLWLGFPSHSVTVPRSRNAVLTPKVLLPSVWPLPLSLATTRGISVDFSSFGYLDVSVPRVPFLYLWIQYRICRSSLQGFPHSEIRGSKLICSSPRLIAACHVLLRLPVPRHSPYALLRLNFCISLLIFSSPIA